MQPQCASEFEHIEDDDDKDKLSCASVNIDIMPPPDDCAKSAVSRTANAAVRPASSSTSASARRKLLWGI